MKKWQTVRWVLRAAGIVAGAIAVAPVTLGVSLPAGLLFVAERLAAGVALLAIDLPRDEYTPEERAKKKPAK